MTPGDALSYGGTPMAAGRVLMTATGMQPTGVVTTMPHAVPHGSAYVSMQSRPTTSSGSYSATPVREPSAYAVAPARELTATTTSTPAPVIVSRLVSQNSFSNLPRYPQVVSGAAPGQSYAMPEAYTISATSGAIAEKTIVQTYTTPISTMDVNETMKAVPIWPGTLGATSVQLRGDEADALRQTVAFQDSRIRDLSQEIQASHENAARLSDELEKARGEVTRLTIELQQERFAREQAEAALQHPQQGIQALTPTASASGFTKRDAGLKPGAANARTASASRRAREVRDLMDGRDDAAAACPLGRPMTASERREAAAAERRAAVLERRAAAEAAAAERRAAAEIAAAERRAAADAAADFGAASRALSKTSNGRSKESPGASRPASAKDDIDSRLLDYVARSQCSVVFKRLNRGFYAFYRRGDEATSVSADRTIEISIVNGKLMVKMEPSTTHPGWNNGKVGPIERFVLKMSAD